MRDQDLLFSPPDNAAAAQLSTDLEAVQNELSQAQQELQQERDLRVAQVAEVEGRHDALKKEEEDQLKKNPKQERRVRDHQQGCLQPRQQQRHPFQARLQPRPLPPQVQGQRQQGCPQPKPQATQCLQA